MEETAHGHLTLRLEKRDSLENLVPEPELESLPPDTAEVYEDMLENLGFDRITTATEEDKQLVVEGQVLVLGDSREGKTSLVNALTGKKYNPEQPKTYGVETQLVNQKWRQVADEEQKFGDFDRFVGTELAESAFVPRIFNEDKYRYKKNVQDPDRLEIAFYNLLFGRVFAFIVTKMRLYHGLFIADCSHENAEFLKRYSRAKLNNDCHIPKLVGSLLIWFAVAPLFSLVPAVGHWGSFVFVVCVSLGINIFKTLKGEGIQQNFFEFWGTLLGFEFVVSVLGINHSVCDLSIIFCHNFMRFGYMRSFPLFAELLRTIVNAVIMLIISLVSQLIFFVIISFIRYIFSFQLPYSGNVKLLLDIVLDFRECLLDMLFLLILSILRVLFFPIPPLPYRYYFPPIILCLHVLLMIQQDLIKPNVTDISRNYYFYAVFVAELSILAIALYHDYEIFTIALELACFQIAIHCCGRWCQVKKLFKGKSFIDVIFKKDFVTHALTVEKATLDKRKLKEALDKKYGSLKLKVFDFAGDEDYYYYHHIFLKTHAIYIIVFNTRNFVSENFKDIKRNMKRLRFWFESVCAHVPPQVPIILVGTHRGAATEKQLVILDCHLREELWGDFCDHIIVNDQDDSMFFHVENSAGTYDKGVQLLRTTIQDTARTELANARDSSEVPLSWIKVQDYILTAQGKPAVCCMRVEEFQNAVSNICSEFSTDMLQYFHQKGLIIYLHKDEELCKWILLNPALLVDVIVQVVNPAPGATQERGYRQFWQVLTTSGMLAEDLLHSLLCKFGDDWQIMKKFLEGYDLICPSKHPESENQRREDLDVMSLTHFIPSMLPLAASMRPIWCTSADDQKFYVLFEGFPPEPLFHRLMSRAYKLSYLSCPNSGPTVFRDDGLFWITPQQPYRLTLLKMEGLVEVTISRYVSFYLLPCLK